MKVSIKLLAIAFVVSVAAACASGGQKTEARDAQDEKSANFETQLVADLDQSMVKWEGYKPTGRHFGTVSLSDGELKLSDGNIVGGSFTMDMNSIVVEDLEPGEMNDKLRGHLLSADFFEVETYPQATFVITEVKAIDGASIDKSAEKGDLVPTHAISGNLTMKGITKNITFNAKVNIAGNTVSAETNQFFVDRAEWNVQYGSRSFFDDLKDNFINDEMGINIKLVANADQS
jgi:polyisoprenoid-binding protein YceI